MHVWVRERVGPIECDRCRGRLAFVCGECHGEGAVECNMGHDHGCPTCDGTGFRKCVCTPRIEWNEIPRPLVELCGIAVSAWDLLDKLSSIRALIVKAREVHTMLELQTRSALYTVPAGLRHESESQSQPLLRYPARTWMVRSRRQRAPRRSGLSRTHVHVHVDGSNENALDATHWMSLPRVRG